MNKAGVPLAHQETSVQLNRNAQKVFKKAMATKTKTAKIPMLVSNSFALNSLGFKTTLTQSPATIKVDAVVGAASKPINV